MRKHWQSLHDRQLQAGNHYTEQHFCIAGCAGRRSLIRCGSLDEMSLYMIIFNWLVMCMWTSSPCHQFQNKNALHALLLLQHCEDTNVLMWQQRKKKGLEPVCGSIFTLTQSVSLKQTDAAGVRTAKCYCHMSLSLSPSPHDSSRAVRRLLVGK